MAGSNALGKDGLGRSPPPQQYDYFRQRQMWLDIGQMGAADGPARNRPEDRKKTC
jgi:hypothetical protein